jgi:hypothetical protein
MSDSLHKLKGAGRGATDFADYTDSKFCETKPFRTSLPSPRRGKYGPLCEICAICGRPHPVPSPVRRARVIRGLRWKITKRTQSVMNRRFKIPDLRAGGPVGGHRPPLQRFSKRTQFPIRVLGVHSWFNPENYETNPCARRAVPSFWFKVQSASPIGRASGSAWHKLENYQTNPLRNLGGNASQFDGYENSTKRSHLSWGRSAEHCSARSYIPRSNAPRSMKITKRTQPVWDRRFQHFRSQIVPDRRSQTAATGFCETNPSLNARFRVSSSRFKVIKQCETNPTL